MSGLKRQSSASQKKQCDDVEGGISVHDVVQGIVADVHLSAEEDKRLLRKIDKW
jgi:hypothetical protein